MSEKPLMPEKPLLLPGRYRHFKGGEYQVLDLARDSETEEWVVVYRPLYGDRGLWVRLFSHFNQLVEKNGTTVPRFVRIGD